jgi:hypothetical protein
MSAQPTSPLPPPAPPPQPTSPPRPGRLVAGILLVLLGVGWLFEVLGVAELPWDVLLPSALIFVGLALVLLANRGTSQAGLITTGLVLTVILLIGTAVDIPFTGGVGERTERPTAIADIDSEYRLAIGQLTLDLTRPGMLTDGSSAGRVRVRVGIGQLIVFVPPDVAVRVEARAGLGSVRVFDEQRGGFDVERLVSPPGGTSPAVEIVATVGIGEVQVDRRLGRIGGDL